MAGTALTHRTYGVNVSSRMIMGILVKNLWINGYSAMIMDRGMSETGRIRAMSELGLTMICGLHKTNDIKSIIGTVDRNEIYIKRSHTI
jgi:hypothetical protein